MSEDLEALWRTGTPVADDPHPDKHDGLGASLAKKAVSAAAGFANMGTFGHADEIAGGINALTDEVGKPFGLAPRPDMGLADRYARYRDSWRNTFNKIEHDEPVAHMVGAGAAIVPGLFAKAPVAAAQAIPAVASRAAGLGAKIAPFVKQGAVYGALGGAGSDSADLTKGEVGGYAGNIASGGALGAGIGGAIGGAVAGVNSLAGRAGNIFQGLRSRIAAGLPQRFSAASVEARPAVEAAARPIPLTNLAPEAAESAGRAAPTEIGFEPTVKRAAPPPPPTETAIGRETPTEQLRPKPAGRPTEQIRGRESQTEPLIPKFNGPATEQVRGREAATESLIPKQPPAAPANGFSPNQTRANAGRVQGAGPQPNKSEAYFNDYNAKLLRNLKEGDWGGPRLEPRPIPTAEPPASAPGEVRRMVTSGPSPLEQADAKIAAAPGALKDAAISGAGKGAIKYGSLFSIMGGGPSVSKIAGGAATGSAQELGRLLRRSPETQAYIAQKAQQLLQSDPDKAQRIFMLLHRAGSSD